MRLTIKTPTQRRRALLTLWKMLPADYDVRGFFVGGPIMVTNWDLIARLMAISLLAATYADCAAAIAAMDRREQSARLAAGNARLVKSVLLSSKRTRVRHRKAA